MKILIAVDGSQYSEWAIDTISKLPLQHEPEIEIVRSVESPYLTPFDDSALDQEFNLKMKQLEEESITEAEENVAQLAERLRARWKKTEGLVIRHANPADRIIDRAEEIGADLLVVGSRGLSTIEQFLMGSVSTKVVAHAPCSVLVVKKRLRSLNKILVAVDGSEYSRHSVAFLERHFAPDEVDISFLYVWPYAYDPPKAMIKNASTAIEEVFAAQLKEKGFSTRSILAEGDPAEEIMDEAKKRSSHLVVVGSRGLAGVQRFFLGSVSQKVIKYTDRSVLVIK